jgi:hypothetical protein
VNEANGFNPICPADASALDAMLNEGDAAFIDAERRERIGRALSLLDRGMPGEAVPAGLADRTLMRVRGASVAGSACPAEWPVLCDEDGLLLEALIEARAKGHDTTPVLADDVERFEKLRGVLSLLDQDTHAGAEQSEASVLNRVQSTLEAIERSRQRDRFAQQIDMMRLAPPARGIGVSWRQVVGAAAVFLLAVSVILPTIDRTRAEANRAACLGNLATAGQAIGNYAADFAGMLPRGKSVPGSPWWNVGRPDAVDRAGNVYSNSAHLYRLVNTRYIDADKLACVTNEYAPRHGQMTVHQLDWNTPLAISYSYQNQFTPEPIRVNDASPILAVLADKNPLFVVKGDRVAFDANAPLTSPSVLHRAQGQNVLKIDGSAGWSASPVVTHDNTLPTFSTREDNIWSVFGIDRYQGNETPSMPTQDAFLVP